MAPKLRTANSSRLQQPTTATSGNRAPSSRNTRTTNSSQSKTPNAATKSDSSDVTSNHNNNGNENYDPGVDEGSNIRVVARCRGRNDREIKAKSNVVVDVQSNTEVAVRVGEELSSKKVYGLDRIFGSETDQSMIFDEVVSPIVDDLLSGMNCTVFAYGQTGTGKT